MNKDNWSLERLILYLLTSWLVIGIVFSLASFSLIFYKSVAFLLVVPLLFLCLIFFKVFQLFSELEFNQKLLLFLLSLIWLLHATGLFVPETGFDAVWYHLPLAYVFTFNHGLIYLDSYYQSLNPLFADLIFAGGFHLWGELGTKIVAYLFALTLLFVSYVLSRKVMSRNWSLLAIISISLIQVVTWQASSFYVDLAKGVWELSAVWLLLKLFSSNGKNSKSYFWLASFMFGASLGTKLFSLALIPVFFIMILMLKGSVRKAVLFNLNALLMAAPFYARAYLESGDPFISITLHLEKLSQIGGSSSLIPYLVSRLVLLPHSVLQLTLFSKDYVSPLIIIFLPLLVWKFKFVWESLTFRVFGFFALSQLMLWWFLPPISTRYAVSGFVVLLIILFGVAAKVSKEKREFAKPILLTILIINLFLSLPRVWVAKRNMEYILGRQTKQEYLNQFYDGWIDLHLKRWHQLK